MDEQSNEKFKKSDIVGFIDIDCNKFIFLCCNLIILDIIEKCLLYVQKK